MTTLPKVIFELDCTDGFPPIQHEMLNAEALEGDRYRLKNVPFFVENVSYDDVVIAIETDDPGKFNFLVVEERSSYTSLSIVLLDDAIADDVKGIFDGHHCVVEYAEFGVVHVLAVAVPIYTPYAPLREQLLKLQEQEKLSVAELAIAHR